jgi:hypothetical protein
LVFADESADLDVDRTDFSDPALNEDQDVEEGPSQYVMSASLLPDTSENREFHPRSPSCLPQHPRMSMRPRMSTLPQPAVHSDVQIGVNNTLLVSLSNLGGKMYNVTYIDGYLETFSSAERLGNFRRQMFGEALGPREQRSFRYLFVPPTAMKPGEYRLVFMAHYQSRDMTKFVDAVFNKTAELKPASSKGLSLDTLLLGGGVVAGGALLLVVMYILGGGGIASAVGGQTKQAPTAKKATAGPEGASDWLQGTLAGSEGRPLSKKKKKL